MGWTTPVTDSQLVAIHAALVPTEPDGVVVYFGDWTGGEGGVGVQEVTHTRLHHLGAGHPAPIEPLSGADVLPSTDVFCGGQAFLADGRLLAAGGTFGWADSHEGIHAPHYDGERACWMYLPRAQRWVPVADLNFQPGSHSIGGGRWYPTLVTLANGEVFAVGGHPAADDYYPTNVGDAAKRHNNNTPERYSAGSNSWTLMTADITAPDGFAYATDGYPRFHLLPDGMLFSDTAGKDSGDGALSKQRVFDPFAGVWTGPDIGGLDVLPGTYDRGSAATSVLLPLLPPLYRARILACNSDHPTAFRIDVDDSPTWVPTVPRTIDAAKRNRENACATILPTGQVLVTGGWPGGSGADDLDAATREPELYTPGIDWDAGDFSNSGDEEWITVADPAPNRRGYHSTALLLPDGRVWHGGSTTSAEPLNKEIDLYAPDYVDAAGRPEITSAPTNIGYQTTFQVVTPQADSIARVALLRCGSITHGFNTDQRYVGLTFSVTDGNMLSVAAPPNGSVAPPGYYMLWLIDEAGRPCERASFVRVSRQKLVLSADVSTFSIHEVDALGTPATFSSAVYVAADGFLPSEVSAPTFDLLWQNNDEVPGITLAVGTAKYEAGSAAGDVAQRIVYPVHVTFTSTAAFDGIPAGDDFRTMVLYARMGIFVGFIQLQLSRNPNPRMSDGDPPWLSIDVRVFKTNPGEAPTAGVVHPDDGVYDYIQDVLAAYNGWAGGAHPFDALPTDQEVNRLELATHDVDDNPVFNYAVARVRFRAPEGVDAADVRVFFRMWTTGWTALEFDVNGSYRRMGNGSSATPLLGLHGGEINNVPCFAEPRAADMEIQTDTHNRRTLQGNGSAEVFAYFGCWLDVNQDVDRFPDSPTHNGPFGAADGELKSIQKLMRGLHQCLVAEIHYDLDQVVAGATPGSSDNLAQRNILFDDSDNPGGFASHLVHHTFELQPSPVSFAQWETLANLDSTSAAGRLHPDELVIEWGNLPRDSLVTFYMPQVDAGDVVRADAMRQSPGNLAAVAPGTIRCKVTDVGFIPIPGPFDQTIAGLLSVQLPPGVQSGAEYTVVMRQVAGRTFKVLGTTEFRIRVGHAAELLPYKLHDLSVLRHVAAAIPAGNRWVPVFERYLGELEDRIRAFGGDPDHAVPSPTGHPGGAVGRPVDEGGEDGEEPGVCVSGRVGRLFYDCNGDFEGFELRRCDGAIRIRECERGIERLVLTACERNLVLTIHRQPDDLERQRYTLGCGPCTCCDHPHDHAPVPAPPPRPAGPARRPESPPRRRPRSRPPDAGLGIIDVAHGPAQHGGRADSTDIDHRHKGRNGHDH
jgi:hypothetical protein